LDSVYDQDVLALQMWVTQIVPGFLWLILSFPVWYTTNKAQWPWNPL